MIFIPVRNHFRKQQVDILLSNLYNAKISKTLELVLEINFDGTTQAIRFAGDSDELTRICDRLNSIQYDDQTNEPISEPVNEVRSGNVDGKKLCSPLSRLPEIEILGNSAILEVRELESLISWCPDNVSFFPWKMV